jgi:anti-sigma28 factor (negative regulator of flagellin synthesis)
VNIQSDFQTLPGVRRSENTLAAGAPHAGQSAVNEGGAKDETSLSAAAVEIARSVASSDVRMDKVGSIQAALATESYRVSSSDVAAKLIEHMQSNNG